MRIDKSPMTAMRRCSPTDPETECRRSVPPCSRISVRSSGRETSAFRAFAKPILPPPSTSIVGWQLDPGKVRIDGRRWEETLAALVADVARGLGVDEPVAADFYKLLVYDDGGFFVDHRETEKAPACSRQWSSCCLRFTTAVPLSSGTSTAKSCSIRTPKSPPKSVLPPSTPTACTRSGHTPAELSFAALKGADAGMASVAVKAATEADCEIYLALLTIEESGSAGYTGYGGWKRRGSDDGDDEEDEDEFEVGELIDDARFLSEWRRPDDQPAASNGFPSTRRALPARCISGSGARRAAFPRGDGQRRRLFRARLPARCCHISRS